MNENTVPSNAVGVTTTFTLMGGMSFTTTLIVQTHRLNEIEEALDLAWRKTKQMALTPVEAK